MKFIKTIMLTLCLCTSLTTDVYATDVPYINEEYLTYINDINAEYGYNICPQLILAQAWYESRYDTSVISNKQCVGLMQIDPQWHKARMARLGVSDLNDPYDNLLVAIDYMTELSEKTNDVCAALMYYNMKHSTAQNIIDKGQYSKYATDICAISKTFEEETE